MNDSSSFIPALHKPSSLLPIARHKDALLYTVEKYPVTVLIGQTGSGKTTQLPQYLQEAGWCNDGKIIALTAAYSEKQPRRVAATTVAKRVAEEIGCQLGQEVGYSIRFEDVTSAATKIKFLTDGLLLREALVDPLLSRYSVIMVDEAHERSLSSDVLLGVLKKIRKRRSELRIVISSATLQAENFLHFFASSEDTQEADNRKATEIGRIVSVEGRAFPVDTHYLSEPCEEYLERAIKTVFDIHTTEPEGDVLIFLTGRDEIERAIEMIADRLPSLPRDSDKILPYPLYAGLTTEQQMYVFEPAPENTRKVICSTNIAEASVTIDGIVYVIDSGFVKLRAFNPTTGIETLTATPVSKASATQRAGRAGRTKPGKCYRLYTEAAFTSLEDATVPEIQRSNLAPTILQLKALGIDNIARFDFITPPPSELIIRALELLYSLGALDDYAKLTKPLGTRMAELALEPMLAKCLLSAKTFDCLSEILTIAAMVSLQGNVWFTHDLKKAEETARRKFAVEEGDHLTLLNVYQAFVTKGKKEAKWCQQHYLNFKSMTRAVSIRNQLRRYLERFGIDVTESLSGNDVLKAGGRPKEESIRRCLTSGYFAHAARMQPDGTFRTIDGGTVLHAHPSSLMFNRKADWVIFTEIMETGDKTFIRDVTKIEKGWLLEYAPDFYKVSSGR
ncbi:putative ATP-dependent RNA helicase DHX35 [Pseudocercospora fuligena]|uniref:RNA helicase n=1 Tax=Pseudocercospora fuligena TaxID=685502 RepID=A0A8H6R5L5_9PEZI|nr:putative ATP-dependent RNA helicase DHX35 [Pseudocercospora fuligena]